jgi:hypothetical protein
MDDDLKEESYRILPPILNWKERESGIPGQLPLHALRDEPSQAERIFISLAEHWWQGISSTLGNESLFLNDEIEKTQLACLLLAKKYGSSFTKVAYDEIEQNISLAKKWRCEWIYALPWQLAMATQLETPSQSHAIDLLVANLNHQNSTIRMWLLQVTWVLQSWVKRETAFEPLIRNTAGSVFGGDESWVIAATLFESENDFFAEVDRWNAPEDVGDLRPIYMKNLKKYRSSLRHLGNTSLWRLEAECWRIIAERSLS